MSTTMKYGHLSEKEKLRWELESLRQENSRLREALRLLYDNQNGPPLYKYQKQWNEAMQLASEALGIKADYES